jgi:carboxyl-terminal processing protease
MKWTSRSIRAAPWGAVVVLLLAVGMIGGIVYDRQVLLASVPSGDTPKSAAGAFRLMAEAWNLITRFYVDRPAVQPQAMTYGAISGMVDALGDTGHSHFLSPEMVKTLQALQKQDTFKGIGAEIQMRDGRVVIVAPLDGSPAEKAGLHPGDVILKVGGKDVAGLPLIEVVKRIKGPAGTPVTLTIFTPGTRRTHDVTIVRATIVVHSVTWARLPGETVAHVRIAQFNGGVTEEVGKTLREIEKAELSGIILDLRNNPGGLLDEAVGTASLFLRSGNVLAVKDAEGHVQSIPVVSGAVAPDMPMVALINDGTASAAEIVAGALLDHRRATLVGQKTFGTGTVLKEFPLTDGSALLLAIEEWLTPTGHTIWHKGITPNIEVTIPPDAMLVIPAAERTMTAAQLVASNDSQLLRGLAWLTTKSERRQDGEK